MSMLCSSLFFYVGVVYDSQLEAAGNRCAEDTFCLCANVTPFFLGRRGGPKCSVVIVYVILIR
jgi:hypothetical protein